MSLSSMSFLTQREREIIELLGEGMSAKQIATRLFLSRRTVEGHLSRAYRKLGVRRRMEALKKAAELSLVPEQWAARASARARHPAGTGDSSVRENRTTASLTASLLDLTAEAEDQQAM